MRAGMSPIPQKARGEAWGVMAGDLEGRGGKDVGRKVGEQHCAENYVSAASDLVIQCLLVSYGAETSSCYF